MLTSSALVLLMVPGLALFYGGMVRHKNIMLFSVGGDRRSELVNLVPHTC